MRHNPSNECKSAETCPNIVGEPKEYESKDGEVTKKAVPGKCPTVSRRTVLGLVKGAK